MKAIRWNQGIDYEKTSKCKRFEIKPIFCDVGPHVPAEYELFFLQVSVGLHPTQRMAKDAANEYRNNE